MQNQSSALVNYQLIEQERLSEIQHSITERLQQVKEATYEENFGGDSLRHRVLHHIVAGGYAHARVAIDRFIADNREYRTFQRRSERLRRYCNDLINAIEAKRNFHGLGSLPLAKQQEIYERVVEHFEDLKSNLKNIERYQKEARLIDVRSTTWVLKALFNCIFFVFTLAFVLDLKNGLLRSMGIVFDSFVNHATDSIFRFLGW